VCTSQESQISPCVLSVLLRVTDNKLSEVSLKARPGWGWELAWKQNLGHPRKMGWELLWDVQARRHRVSRHGTLV